MSTTTDRIEREVRIAAPVERVWALVTEAEHLGSWFGDAGAEVDLRPGGEMTLRWEEWGVTHARVERVEPPHRFSWRWLLEGGSEPADGNSTLVEFTLADDGGETLLTVVEAGFDGLALPQEERRRRYASHTGGWERELDELAVHARQPAAR
jgi:uncharacterized protein YndB with AHSA1/START domain